MNNITQYTDIPGYGNFDKIYKELVLSLPDNASILELGVAFGRGTWAMLDAMRGDMSLCVLDSFHDTSSGLLHWITSWGNTGTMCISDFEMFKSLSMIDSHREMFLRTISQHSKYHQLQTVYTMPSELYISSKYPTTYDLVFLDGDHSYESVKNELEYFKDCTIITGHDYNNVEFWPDVKIAVDEFMANHPNRSIRIHEEHMVYVIT